MNITIIIKINKEDSIKLTNKTGLKKEKKIRRDLTFFKFQEVNLTSSEVRESAGDSADRGQRPRPLNEIMGDCWNRQTRESQKLLPPGVWVQVPHPPPSWRGTLSL